MARLHHALFTGVGNNAATVPSVTGSQMAVGGLQNPDGSGAANPSLIGMSLILSGAGHSGNNGTFQIIQYESPFEVVVYNPSAFSGDTSITWKLAFTAPAGLEGPVTVRACGGGGGGGGSGGTQGLTNNSSSGAGGAGALVTQWSFDYYSAALGGNAAEVLVAGPTVSVAGLTNMSPAVVGYNLTISGSSVGANNGSWVISAYNSPTSVNIINGSASPDLGSDTWSVGIIPGLAIPVLAGAGGTAGSAGLSTPTAGGNGGVGGNTTFGGNIIGYGAQGGVGGGSDASQPVYSLGGAAGVQGANTLASAATVPPAVWTPPGFGGVGSNDNAYAALGSAVMAAVGGGQPGAAGGGPGSLFALTNGGGGGGAGAPGSAGGQGGVGNTFSSSTAGFVGTGFGAGGGGGGGVASAGGGTHTTGRAGAAGTSGMCEFIWTA